MTVSDVRGNALLQNRIVKNFASFSQVNNRLVKLVDVDGIAKKWGLGKKNSVIDMLTE